MMAKKMPKAPKTYEVGYGLPPKQTQFKPGHSGNPKGRPKGTPTLQDLFQREAAKLVSVKTGPNVLKITKADALVRKMIQMAFEGHMPAMRMVWSFLEAANADDPEQAETAMAPIFGSETPDEEAVKRIAARLLHLVPDDEGDADA